MNNLINEKRPRVCIYCPYCYPIFNPQFKGHFGGWEVRVSVIAKELARRGNFDITIIVADNGQPQVEYREGVRLISWIGKEFWKPPVSQVLSDDDSESSVPIPMESQEKATLSPDLVPMEVRKSIYYSIRHRLSKHASGKTRIIINYLAKSFSRIMSNLYRDNIEALKILISPIRTLFKPFHTALTELIFSTRQALHMRSNLWGVIIDQNASFLIQHKDVDLINKIDADIYIVPGNHSMSAITAFFCKTRKKRYIFLAGSDMDYYPEFKTQPDKSDIYGEPHYLKAYAIEQADLHIVQTQRQADMLQQGFERSAHIILNPIDLSSALPRVQNADKILWVGNTDERVKRPSLVFELARQLPHFSFVIIMKPITKDDVLANAKAAQELPNVDLKFDVPFAEIENHFAGAKLFVSTSVFEGFPNTFLQAAKYGVPIISTIVDPGGILSQHGCGIACDGDFERFVESVRRLMKDDDLYMQMSLSALHYVRTYHDKDIIIAQFEKAFREVLGR
jgi:glycosyltransferase involved in cell wall biosynthesis